MENNKYEKIFLAYNGSENCYKALKRAIQLSKMDEIELNIIVVTEFINSVTLDISATGLGSYAPIYVDEEYNPEEIIKNKRNDIIKLSKKLNFEPQKIEVLFGNPTDEILNYISMEKSENSLLVLSSSDKKKFEKLILGSVARTISEKSPIDVLIVRK